MSVKRKPRIRAEGHRRGRTERPPCVGSPSTLNPGAEGPSRWLTAPLAGHRETGPALEAGRLRPWNIKGKREGWSACTEGRDTEPLLVLLFSLGRKKRG